MGETVDYTELQALVPVLKYKPGWSFKLRYGLTFTIGDYDDDQAQPTGNINTVVAVPAGVPVHLVITAMTEDSGDPAHMLRVTHHLPVPPAHHGSWKRWLLEMILAVERHEACEFFQIGDDRPFYPEHGPDARLYEIRERT